MRTTVLFAKDSRTPVHELFATVRVLVRELRKRTQSPYYNGGHKVLCSPPTRTQSIDESQSGGRATYAFVCGYCVVCLAEGQFYRDFSHAPNQDKYIPLPHPWGTYCFEIKSMVFVTLFWGQEGNWEGEV